MLNCQEVNIVFFCSRIRSRDFNKISYFYDIIIDERDFEEGLCDMRTSTIDLDICLERPIYLSDLNLNLIHNVIIIKRYISQVNF